MANRPFFELIYCATHRRAAAAHIAPDRGPPESGDQQPRQMFFSRAFISASSALIVSTYVAESTFEAEVGRGAGVAAADGAGAAFLS